jgi:hypothetical protein
LQSQALLIHKAAADPLRIIGSVQGGTCQGDEVPRPFEDDPKPAEAVKGKGAGTPRINDPPRCFCPDAGNPEEFLVGGTGDF